MDSERRIWKRGRGLSKSKTSATSVSTRVTFLEDVGKMTLANSQDVENAITSCCTRFPMKMTTTASQMGKSQGTMSHPKTLCQQLEIAARVNAEALVPINSG